MLRILTVIVLSLLLIPSESCTDSCKFLYEHPRGNDYIKDNDPGESSLQFFENLIFLHNLIDILSNPYFAVNCYLGDGSDYRGTIDTDSNGNKCLAWSSRTGSYNDVHPSE